MNLTELKAHLLQLDTLSFKLPDNTMVPKHFHVTEIATVNKSFIDCGGTLRHEQTLTMQLWVAGDVEHRLTPIKMLNIIDIAEKKVGLGNANVEIEYQQQTIGRFGLQFNNNAFELTNLFTDCLASDKCGIPTDKLKVSLAELTPTATTSCCTPGSGCC